ncbi:MAG: hypothetical protein HXY52_05145 [Nitrospirae bacterium]|nr:hypothetical protein [Nitrospirota bacterium]
MILRFTKFIFISLILIFIFGMFAGRIWDPDFWWHLKTGEYIYTNGSLPETDPFAYTTLPKDPLNPESKRIKFILTSYWLSQIIFFLIYKLAGLQGIIFFRATILTVLIYFVYRAIRREGADFYSSIILIIPSVIILSNFTGERPQLFSFLFVFLLVYLFEGFRMAEMNISRSSCKEINSGHRNSNLLYLLPIPFIMLLWANMHGGVFIGVIILSIYIICESIKFFKCKTGNSLPSKQLRILIVVCFLSILITILNPNKWDVFSVLIEFQKSKYMESIVESRSPFIFLSAGFYNQEIITYIFLIIFCMFFVIINFKSIDITDLVILLFFLYMSVTSARTIPFFATIYAPFTVRYAIKTMRALNNKLHYIERLRSFSEKFKLGSLQPLLITLLSIVMFIVLANTRIINKGIVWERYPKGSAEFLKNNRIHGNMLNPYVWGGYLIWALYPDYKVFVDGRGLIEEVFFQNSKIFSANLQQFGDIPEWQAFMKVYNINFIITYSVNDFTGNLIPIIPFIMNDPEWLLVYMDNNSLIFVRESPENSEIIRKYEMPKKWVWNEIITEAAYKVKNVPQKTNFYITMGDAFFAKQDFQDARTMYLKAREINPSNSIVIQRLNSLNSIR